MAFSIMKPLRQISNFLGVPGLVDNHTLMAFWKSKWDETNLISGGRMFYKVGSTAEVCLLEPTKCRSLVNGTSSVPSLRDIMGQADVNREIRSF